MTNRDIKRTAIMYTDFGGTVLSDESTALTPYPIIVGFDENRNLIVIPTPPGEFGNAAKEDSENVD